MSETFNRFNWAAVARALAGNLKGRRDRLVEIYSERYGVISIYDNGGEINLSFEKPNPDHWHGLKAVSLALKGLDIQPETWTIGYSIPYTNWGGKITDLTLAYRLRAAMLNEKIDWDFTIEDV